MQSRSPLAESVREALEAQSFRNERVVAATGIAFAAIGVGVSLILWFAPGPSMAGFRRDLAPSIFGVTIGVELWFVTTYLLLRRGLATRAMPWISTVVEASFASLLMLVEARSQSPGYVTWVTLGPQVQIFAFVLAIARLRAPLVLLAGVVSSVEYAALLAYAVPRLPTIAGDPILRAPLIYTMRPLMLLAAGVIGALVVQRLRATVGSVHTAVRSEELFGKYRLGKLLASGGMGTVYEATYCPEGGFSKRVAVKRIHGHLADDEWFVDAFRREAELGSRLTHPNIVQVLDFGTEGGGYFLAMEFVDGLTLHELMKRARTTGLALPPALVAWAGRQIASGLAFAHTEARDATGGCLHVIHRDLSPANVLLSRAGEVKVTDFGVAKALGDKSETVTTSMVGKLAYMAPEQLLGQPMDERCDLFALGVILWEALCGRRLFQSDSDGATVHDVLHKAAPPPSTQRSDLGSGRWDDVVARALSRDRDARFSSAAEMASALEGILADEAAFTVDAMARFVASTLASRAVSTTAASNVAAPLTSSRKPHEAEETRLEGRAADAPDDTRVTETAPSPGNATDGDASLKSR